MNYFQLFANTISQQMFNKDFKKELLEERHYWSEEQFEDKMKEIRKIMENPDHKSHKYYKDYEWEYNWFRKYVDEGSYDADYEDEKDYIKGLIEPCFERVKAWRIEHNDSTPRSFKSLRSKLLYYLFWELFDCSEFLYRNNEVMKEDIRKIVMEYNLHNLDKKDFVEDVKYYNSHAVGYDSDTMTINIDREFYIDLGTHGEEYLGLHDFHYKDSETQEWKIRQHFFDKVEFVEV